MATAKGEVTRREGYPAPMAWGCNPPPSINIGVIPKLMGGGAIDNVVLTPRPIFDSFGPPVSEG